MTNIKKTSLIDLFKERSISNMTEVQIRMYLKYVLKRFKLNVFEHDGNIFLDNESKENIETFNEIINKYNNVISNTNNYYTIPDLCNIFSLGPGRIRTLIKKGAFEVYGYLLDGPHYTSYFLMSDVNNIKSFLDNTVSISEIVDIVKKEYTLDLTYSKVKHFLKNRKVMFYDNPIHLQENRILKDDLVIFEEFPIMDFDSNLYYTISEIELKFKINAYAGTYGRNIIDKKYFRGVGYYNKAEVDRLFYIDQNSITLNEICEELDIILLTLRKKLKQYGIKYHRGGTKIHRYSVITMESYSRFIEMYNEEQTYNNIEDIYDKFLYNISRLEDNIDAKKSKKAFMDFSVERYNINKNKKHLVKPLVEIYKEVLLTINKEIILMEDKEIIKLISKLKNKSKKTREEFVLLLEYISENYEVNYKNKYTYTGRLNKNTTKTDFDSRRKSKAYTHEQWINFGALVFLNLDNQEYMEKALNTRMNSMVWLYCSLHYCSAWRKSDYINMLPKLELNDIIGISSEHFIDWLKSGNYFTLDMGQAICNYIILELKMFNKRHMKNKRPLRLDIANSLIRPIGLLIAIAESHRKRNETDPEYYNYTTNTILTNACSHKDNHIIFFGEEKYNKIFKNRSFNNLGATTTYLHNVVNESSKQNWNIGYYLASISRGHTLNEREIALTTQTYLSELNKDNDLDIISFNLHDRGSFGFIYYKLLSIVYGNSFEGLNLDSQTKLIKDLGAVSPFDIEIINKRLNDQRVIIDNFLLESLVNKEDYIVILKKLAQGEFPSKMSHSQCLLKITGKNKCKFPVREECIGCDFLMPELFFLFKFNNLLNNLIKNIHLANLEFDKLRLGNILINSYLPLLNEAIKYLGYERVNTFIKLETIKNEINNLLNYNKIYLG